MKIGFCGLGTMGFPMAGHLINAGYDLYLYNRSESKVLSWSRKYGGTVCRTPRELAENVNVILTCLGNDDDVRDVYLSSENSLIKGVNGSKIFIDHTTTSAALAKELYQIAKSHQCEFLDAPISGGQSGAENGQLTIMVGGEQAVLDKVEPILKIYGKFIKLIGDSGSGQLCKMVNQISIAGVLQGLSEAIHFTKASNLPVETVVDTIKHGAAGSWQMENRAVSMGEGEFDFGFAIDWMIKDLEFCIEEAEKLKIDLPLTNRVKKTYIDLQKKEMGRKDTSALINQFKLSRTST